MLAAVEIGIESEVPTDLLARPRLAGNRRELKNRLGVVGNRAIRIDGDRDRPHPQKAEGNQSEGKYGWREHNRAQPAVRSEERRVGKECRRQCATQSY